MRKLGWILEGLCNLQVLRRSLLISDLWPHTTKDSDVSLQLLIHGRLRPNNHGLPGHYQL